MKFAKIASVASVAAMTASGAFAVSGSGLSAIEEALADINGAYQTLSQNEGASQLVADHFGDLLYYADNHGAIKSVVTQLKSDDPAARADEGEFRDYSDVSTGGTVSVEVVVDMHNYNSEIATAKGLIQSQIAIDMFGADTLGASDINIAKVDGDWTQNGVTGNVNGYLTSGLVSDLNALDNEIEASSKGYALWSDGHLADIDDAVDALESTAGTTDTALADLATASGVSAVALEGQVRITSAESKEMINGVAYRSYVGEAAYNNIVDAEVSVIAPATPGS